MTSLTDSVSATVVDHTKLLQAVLYITFAVACSRRDVLCSMAQEENLQLNWT